MLDFKPLDEQGLLVYASWDDQTKSANYDKACGSTRAPRIRITSYNVCYTKLLRKERSAVLAGMEILNELFFFNRARNPLDSPLRVRIAAHSGRNNFV